MEHTLNKGIISLRQAIQDGLDGIESGRYRGLVITRAFDRLLFAEYESEHLIGKKIVREMEDIVAYLAERLGVRMEQLIHQKVIQVMPLDHLPLFPPKGSLVIIDCPKELTQKYQRRIDSLYRTSAGSVAVHIVDSQASGTFIFDEVLIDEEPFSEGPVWSETMGEKEAFRDGGLREQEKLKGPERPELQEKPLELEKTPEVEEKAGEDLTVACMKKVVEEEEVEIPMKLLPGELPVELPRKVKAKKEKMVECDPISVFWGFSMDGLQESVGTEEWQRETDEEDEEEQASQTTDDVGEIVAAATGRLWGMEGPGPDREAVVSRDAGSEAMTETADLAKGMLPQDEIRESFGTVIGTAGGRNRLILGKIAGDDLFDSENNVIIKRGEKITTAIIEKAEREGLLADLIINMTLPELAD